VRRAVLSSDEVVRSLDLPAWGKDKGLALDPVEPSEINQLTGMPCSRPMPASPPVTSPWPSPGPLRSFTTKTKPVCSPLRPPSTSPSSPWSAWYPPMKSVIEAAYGKGTPPSQISFITGPSASADIQATPFKGMHGPQKLIVILVDQPA
jgi:L-lactate dehydrogenase complex protein LldG